VLLSPSLLGSEWCKQDLGMGVRQEQPLTRGEPDSTFIHVLQMADVPEQYDGELRKYDWMDLTSPSRTQTSRSS
jgi:hypothetical protein